MMDTSFSLVHLLCYFFSLDSLLACISYLGGCLSTRLELVLVYGIAHKWCIVISSIFSRNFVWQTALSYWYTAVLYSYNYNGTA